MTAPTSTDMRTGYDYNLYQRSAAGVTSMLMLLSTVVVCLRLYIRCIYLGGGSAGWDDATVFIAWVSTTHQPPVTGAIGVPSGSSGFKRLTMFFS